jgi:hypothetical protein
MENAEGKRLMEWIEENGWEVLTGNKQGDEEGEWIFIGSRWETVINYGMVNEEARERVEEFRIGEREREKERERERESKIMEKFQHIKFTKETMYCHNFSLSFYGGGI